MSKRGAGARGGIYYAVVYVATPTPFAVRYDLMPGCKKGFGGGIWVVFGWVGWWVFGAVDEVASGSVHRIVHCDLVGATRVYLRRLVTKRPQTPKPPVCRPAASDARSTASLCRQTARFTAATESLTSDCAFHVAILFRRHFRIFRSWHSTGTYKPAVPPYESTVHTYPLPPTSPPHTHTNAHTHTRARHTHTTPHNRCLLSVS